MKEHIFKTVFSIALVVSLVACGEEAVVKPKQSTVQYGYPTQGPDTQNWTEGYLVSQMFTLANPSTVQNIGIITSGDNGAQVQLAIYADNAGVPGALVDYTSVFTQLLGDNLHPATLHTPLTPGDYWVSFIASIAMDVAADNAVTHGAKYIYLGPTWTLPDPMGVVTDYPHVALNMYFEVSE